MVLEGEIECDEVYLVAGHKGCPEAVAWQGRAGRRRRLKGKRGRGTLAAEKPPIFGILQRGGQVVIRMLENVKQATIKPLIKQTIQPGSLIHTDEYTVYSPLPQWGYDHKTVNHSEGFWSLLRSWLRPHRGISQEKLPLYLAFFEFVYNVRVRGKALLPSLPALLLSPPCFPS